MTRVIVSSVSMLVLFAIWQLMASADTDIVFFAGSPLSVISELFKMVLYEHFHVHFFATGSEALVGLILGTFSGAMLGFLAWYFKPVAYVLLPVVGLLGFLPVLALAPLMIFWFGVGFWMKVVLAIMATFFISFSQAFKGAEEASRRHVEVFRATRAPRAGVLFKIVIPGSLGAVLMAMKLNASMCLLGSFIGEFISADMGLGYLILRSSSLYNMPRALAAAIGIVVLACFFHALATLAESRRDKVGVVQNVPISGNTGNR